MRWAQRDSTINVFFEFDEWESMTWSLWMIYKGRFGFWKSTQQTQITGRCLQLITCLHWSTDLWKDSWLLARSVINVNQSWSLVCEFMSATYLAQCLSRFTVGTHTNTHFRFPANPVVRSVLHYIAMWFLLTAEIQSVLKVSQGNSKIGAWSCHRNELEWFSTFTKQNIPSLTCKTAFVSLTKNSQTVVCLTLTTVKSHLALYVESSGLNYAFTSFMIHC